MFKTSLNARWSSVLRVLCCGVTHQKLVDLCVGATPLCAGVLGNMILPQLYQYSWVVLCFFYDRIALTFIEQIYWYCFKDYIIKFSTLIFCLLDFFALRIVTTVHKWDVSLSFWEVDRLRNYVIAFIQISWKALKFLFPDMVWYLSVWKLVQLPLWSHLLHCLL